MSLLIGFFTFVLILDCVLLVFLVLLQLPKKEAGIGVAFGGGATDALFGAGSGNMLTKITKWVGILFFVLCLGLAVLTSRQSRNTGASALSEELANRPKATPPSGAGLLQTTTNSNVAAPAPEATPVKPTPSSGIGGDTPPTATGTSKTPSPTPTPPAKPSTPSPSPTPTPK